MFKYVRKLFIYYLKKDDILIIYHRKIVNVLHSFIDLSDEVEHAIAETIIYNLFDIKYEWRELINYKEKKINEII